MDRTYWQKQASEPLFPDLVWSRPQNKQTAGKLLIIGGNVHGFAAVGNGYTEAEKAGIGSVRIILPDALRKTVSKLLPEADYAPSTPSGSFGQMALADLLEHAAWANGILLAGDLGRNSETAMLLEKFVAKYSGAITLTKDVVDYFIHVPSPLLERPDTCVVLSMAQLQKLASAAKFPLAFTFDMDFLKLIETLHEFTQQFSLYVVVKHLDTVFVGVSGQVSTTKTDNDIADIWRVPTAAHTAVWWLQNPAKPFEALTTAISKSE